MSLTVEEGPHRLATDLSVEFLRGNIRLTRTDRRLLVQGLIETKVPAECVRCLEPFSLPLRIRFEELFTFYPASPADKTYHISEDGYLNLDRPMYEQVQLAMPIQTLCRPDCKGLCPQCGQNLNEGTCHCSDDTEDPRMAALRTLLE